MKTLGRILIILLAVTIVIGGTYALLQISAVQALVGQPNGSNSFEGRSGPSDLANGQGVPAGEIRSGDREDRGGSWETMGRNLLEIAAIVVAVRVVWSIGRMIKRSVEKRHRLQVSCGS